MRIRNCLLILLITAASGRLSGQTVLGVTIDSFPSQILIGDTVLHSGTIFIHNYGTQSFSDTVYLEYKVDGVTYSSNSPGTGIYFRDSVNISPGDSDKKEILIHFTPSIFQTVGTSGVVIWPISVYLNTLPPDTSSFPVVLTYPAGIAQNSDARLLVYMNGALLDIKTTTGNELKRVRIYTINGQLIEDQAVALPASIAMDKYADGMYLAEIIFADDSHKIFKIINMTGH